MLKEELFMLQTSSKIQNLKIGNRDLQWNESRVAIKAQFPLAVEFNDTLIIGKFVEIDSQISMMATLRFQNNRLESVELAPNLSPEIHDWKTKKTKLQTMYSELAEITPNAVISVESDWADIRISIRRKPLA